MIADHILSLYSHSSSSAIFERDIEPIGFQSSPLKNPDPHHTSRGQAHEPTEQAVPSVLTSAVSALSLAPSNVSVPTSPSSTFKRRSMYDDAGEISVISPAPAISNTTNAHGAGSASLMLSGMITPRSLSRSPSPPATATANNNATTTTALSQSTNSIASSTGLVSPISITDISSASRRSTSPRPLSDAFTSSSPPSAYKPIPVSAAFSGDAAAPSDLTESTSTSSPPSTSSPGTAAAATPVPVTSTFVPGSGPIPRPRKANSQNSVTPAASSPSTSVLGIGIGTGGEDMLALSGVGGGPSNRLSFISYHDLLVSTPLSAAPLSSITSGAAQPQTDPMSILPGLPGAGSQAQAPSSTSGQSSPSPTRGRALPGPGGVAAGVGHATVVGWGKEDGGEWEREGLGKGLEERLEEVLKVEREAEERAKREAEAAAAAASAAAST
ncbi:hypothetical protein DL93DRAFT_1595742 [Clavulina sp. PMI_390]|nr:hypothetical protein DL93DRAFT_1595742 [Clavulina sp. PMI_390]